MRSVPVLFLYILPIRVAETINGYKVENRNARNQTKTHPTNSQLFTVLKPVCDLVGWNHPNHPNNSGGFGRV